MTDSATSSRPHPVRGRMRTTARTAVPLIAGCLLAACGPSPVDMVEHPITTTPSRIAGEELQRAAEPDESCVPAPVPTEFPGSGERRIDTDDAGTGDGDVSVPRSPERILALGAAAVDVACGLGLQDLVVGTSGLPPGADAYLPRPLVDLPDVPLPDDAAPDDVAAAATELRPDLVVLAGGADRDPAVVRALADVAPTVVYDPATLSWTDATETISDAYGRPRAGGDMLLDVIARAQATDAGSTPRDTRASLVTVTDEGGGDVRIQDPDTLGSLMLEAVDAGRPPAQRTRDGQSIPPAPESPPTSDALDGDVIFAVVGAGDRAEETAREAFETERWQELDAVQARRLFVVDRAIWEGAGPVAARIVLADIAESINGIAPEG